MRLLAVVIGVAVVSGCAASAQAPAAASFHSASLGRAMRYQISVPAGAPGTRFPVVYLLHGHGGNETDWFAGTQASDIASGLGLIVVTPDGGNSWYLNTPTERWKDYIVRDLIEEVERRWPVRPGRASRAIAGLSMGGYGAINLALQHPGTFALAASMSGALDTTRPTSVFGRGREDEVNRWFGPPGSATRRDNDIYRLVAEAQPAAVPYLYFDCGVDDPWLRPNQEFAAAVKARGVSHEFHEEPGRHDFAYWGRQIKVVLNLVANRLE